MDIDLTKLTEAELVALNHRVVERIKLLRQSRYHETIAKFQVGDRVSFQPECGHELVATVVRLNRKSVTVVNAEGQLWRVAPSFLTQVAGETAAPARVLELISLAEGELRGRGEA